MLRIAVAGTLSKYIDELAAAKLNTSVEWSELPLGDRELAQLDLVLYLSEDLSGAEKLGVITKENSVIAPTISVWKELPSYNDLDRAIQNSLGHIYGFVVGYSASMHVACRWIRAVAHQAAAALDLRTLIIGETGTGKELVARAIHNLGMRKSRNFVGVNCAAVPGTLLEAELFGHERGAFTGANTRRVGRLGSAAGGTIFLDEVGDLPPELQSKLLRVLEERSYSPLGSDKEYPLDAQVVSATNQRLDEAVSRHEFRPDLYFRLAQVNILMPPLRKRREDIPLLIDHFLRESQFPLQLEINEDEQEALSQYEWPGNIRELRSALERFMLLASAGQKPSPADWLEIHVKQEETSVPRGTLAELRDDFDRKVLEEVLRRAGGNTSAAANELGITRRSIYNLMHRHGIDVGKSK
jgi:transcriptional regulator with GAF, ATPase, and Fis domain